MSRFGWGERNKSARHTLRTVSLRLEALEERVVLDSTSATTFTVQAGDVASLIADIKAGNTNGPNTPTTINLSAGTYHFNAADNNTFGPNALPVITGNITINGNGAVLVCDTVAQSTPLRFFYVSGSNVASPTGPQSTSQPTGNLTLENMTLEDGLAQGGSSGTGGGGLGAGGAIFNQGNLTLNSVTLTQNSAYGGSSGSGTSTSGGNFGSTTTTAGTFGVGGDGSTSGAGGNGGFGAGGGSGTTAGTLGFGAGAGNSTIGGGGLGAGGAIFNMYGTTMLVNCTLASNLAQGGTGATNGDGYGGAIFNVDGTLGIINSTMAYNGAFGAVNGGGAVYNLGMGTTTDAMGAAQGVPSVVTLTNSILADSLGGSSDVVNDQNTDLAGSAVVNSATPNLIMSVNTINSATTQGSIITGDPKLGMLTNNGGLTQTIPIRSGSSALGSGAAGSNVPTTDQRGVQRGLVLDLGSYQATSADVQSTTLSLTSSSTSSSSSPTGVSATLTATVTASSGTTPPGSVDFVDTAAGNQDLGNVAVNAQGVATLTANVAANHIIKATYTSSNGKGNTSAGTAVVLDPATNNGSSNGNNGSSNGNNGSSNGSNGSSNGNTIPGTLLPMPGISPASQNWLNQVYQELLGRSLDAAGLSQWGTALQKGSTPTSVVLGIEQTTEYRTDEIQAAYQFLVGTTPSQDALNYLAGLMATGMPFRDVAAIIAGSDQYFQASGANNNGFLTAVYQDFLNRPLDTAGQIAWGSLLTAGFTPTQVTLGIVSTNEYLTDLVEYDYAKYVGHPADVTSLQAYVSALAKGSMTDEQVVASLIGSTFKA